MKQKNNMGKHSQIILEKMCEVVGADFNKINFKKINWFHDYEWTVERENDFAEWLKKYLLDNKDARQEIMEWPQKDKKRIESVVKEFINNYGWKTKYDPK